MAPRDRPHRSARGRRVRLIRNAELVGAIQEAPAVALDATCWRHIRHGRDPLSGTGARIQGGRWNPPNSFSVIYLATDQRTVVAEFRRLVSRQGLDPENFLPRAMYRYDVALTNLVDVTSAEVRRELGLRDADLRSDDLSACQAVGDAAYACRRSGIYAPSAAGTGKVVAVFGDCLADDETLGVGDYELWETADDVP